MSKPRLVKKNDVWAKEKHFVGLKKTVWEYNSGQFDVVDIASTKVSGTYPIKGWSGNDVVTMLYYIVSGEAEIQLESGEKYKMEKGDVFILPPKTFYKISGEFEALMICSPAWYEDQSIKKN